MSFGIFARSFWLGLFLAQLIPQFAFSAITVSSVSGASRESIKSTIKIYGGALGNCAASSSTCNSCDGSSLTTCNEKEIGDDTELKIRFSSDSSGGTAKLTLTDDSSAIGSTDSVSEGETAEIIVDWSDICDTIEAGQPCTAVDGEKTLRLAFDSNDDGTFEDTKNVTFIVRSALAADDLVSDPGNDGVYDFKVSPGDEKIFVTDVASQGDFPNYSNGGTFEKIHFLYIEVTDENDPCASIVTIGNDIESDNTFSTDFESVDDEDDVELEENFFQGLDNGKMYGFKVGLEDEAGNIGLFTSDGACDAENHAAKPDDVFGVLDEGNNCFVSTATFGDGNHPMVVTLRMFRSKMLLPYSWGRSLVKTYYRYSPMAAQWIQNSDFLRWTSKILLTPFLIYAYLSLAVGHVISILIILAAMIFVFQLFRKKGAENAIKN
jgi:hypothetical protein